MNSNLYASKFFRESADVQEVQVLESTTQFSETTEKVMLICFLIYC
jgi:hypothetical protein